MGGVCNWEGGMGIEVGYNWSFGMGEHGGGNPDAVVGSR